MRKALTVIALVVTAVTLTPVTGSAAGAHGHGTASGQRASTSASAAPAGTGLSKFRVFYSFDRHATLRPGTRVPDASGHKHAGRVLVAAGGRLNLVKGIKGHGASFPKLCHTCGRGIIEAADKKGLDPNGHQFSFGAAVRVGARQAVHGQNILQKGYFNQDGGQWKLQLHPGGIPSCVVFGAAGRLRVDGTASVANGHWHRMTCLRTSTGVRLYVDGKVAASGDGPTGWINNTSPVRVGGKKINPANKQFHGRLDAVFLKVTLPA